VVSPVAATNAYAALAKLTGKAAGAAASPSATSGANFGSMLRDALGSVADTGRKSDAQTQAMVVDKSNIVDVVTAVSETEVAIQTLVSVRDRVIQSYEEIMRMPI
jgi:flagellar hook-basal body complex protein FliE